MLRVLEQQDVSTDAAAVSVQEAADVVSSRLLRDLTDSLRPILTTSGQTHWRDQRCAL